MADSDHPWIQQGQGLGINMERDAIARRLIKMDPEDRVAWLHQLGKTVEADESPLKKKAQLEALNRHLRRVHFELLSVGK